MNKHSVLLGFFAAAVAGGAFWYTSVNAWQPASSPDDEFGLEFRYLGCNDWPENRPYETSIVALPSSVGITYQVSDPAACGYSAREPKYKIVGDTLSLSYDLFTESGMLAACMCEYKSQFHFRSNPSASNVVFESTGG